MNNILLCGVGGQGIVLASRLLGQCAIDKGLFARTAETIGMSQKGGCVTSHVRVDKTVHSPLIPLGQADLLIAMEPGEAVRNLPYLKKDGAVVVCDRPVKPVSDALSKTDYDASEMLARLKERVKSVTVVSGEAVLKTCGSLKPLNLAMLGAASAAGVLPFTDSELDAAMVKLVKPQFIELNRAAIEAGKAAV